MKTLLKLEGLALFGLSIFLFSQLGYAWWWYPVLFFVPDLNMAGYLGGTRLGAIVYNVIHHHAVSISLYALGFSPGSRCCNWRASSCSATRTSTVYSAMA